MVDGRALAQGDIVSFRTENGTAITHRIIGVSFEDGRRTFTTKGDANSFVDPEPLRVSGGKVARVEWVVPYAGYLVRYARTPIGGLVLFGVPILGLILDRRRTGPRSRAAQVPKTVASASVAYPCPHCGGAVAFGLLPVNAESWLPSKEHQSVSASPPAMGGARARVTWPDREAAEVRPQTDFWAEFRDDRDWNFAFEPASLHTARAKDNR